MSEEIFNFRFNAPAHVTFEIIEGIFKDSFSRSIIFCNYLAPRTQNDVALGEGVPIEALVKDGNAGEPFWAEGMIGLYRPDELSIGFNFEHLAYHEQGNITRPRVDRGRLFMIAFTCSEYGDDACDVKISIMIGRKLFGTKPSAIAIEVQNFINDQIRR